MGYTALLFCPEEKTARTVTQVLSELEFTVEACIEPFAAVKKLMGQHFDAVVVDCDNEQNATLLFKSARNSTSNQTSLAVAVVEGQAGVAKAFRIGANLVLTKPINIEQSKGTLRVARGLLRKSEPGKPTAPSTTAPLATGSPTKPAVSKPSVESKPATVAASVPAPAPVVAEPAPATAPVPAVQPTPAWPVAAVASTSPSVQDEDLLDIESKQTNKSLSSTESHPAMSLFAAAEARAQKIMASGAASAPAPARESMQPVTAQKPAAAAIPAPVAKPPAGTVEPARAAVIGSTPSFSFGGMNLDAEQESAGGSKKILVGLVAAIVIAAAGYGAMHFRGTGPSPTVADDLPLSASTKVSQPASPSSRSASQGEEPPAATSPASSQPSVSESNKIQNRMEETARESHLSPDASSTSAAEASEDNEPEPKPLLVKGGKLATRPKAAADAPAPSLIGMASPETAPPAGLVPTTTPPLRPTLSTVNVSQGVSTGLLIKKVAPSYPTNALRMRIEGDVELTATISKQGEITQVKVLSGNSQLTRAAADAVKQWKYKPYLLNGEPVEIQTQITVKFKLPR
jgi:periplasmic protein TonB